jgi:hypothetical protein
MGSRVGQQHDLEQHGGWKGRSAGVVIFEAGIKGAEVNLLVEQMVQLGGSWGQVSILFG